MLRDLIPRPENSALSADGSALLPSLPGSLGTVCAHKRSGQGSLSRSNLQQLLVAEPLAETRSARQCLTLQRGEFDLAKRQMAYWLISTANFPCRS